MSDVSNVNISKSLLMLNVKISKMKMLKMKMSKFQKFPMLMSEIQSQCKMLGHSTYSEIHVPYYAGPTLGVLSSQKDYAELYYKPSITIILLLCTLMIFPVTMNV